MNSNSDRAEEVEAVSVAPSPSTPHWMIYFLVAVEIHPRAMRD